MTGISKAGGVMAGARLFKRLSFKTFSKITKIALYILLFDIAFVFLYPFLYMLVNSLKSPADLMNSAVNWVPGELWTHNYAVAWSAVKYPTYLLNSLIVTVFSTLGHILSASFIAYGFARTDAPFRRLLFAFLVFTIIVPAQVIIIPLYMQYGTFGWINTFLPITVPTFFGFGLRGGIYVFIFRQFFLTLPKELENAAYVDGCGTFRTFFRIIMPISRSSMLVCGIISMVWHWNDYYEPTVYLTKSEMWTLTSRLPTLYDASRKAFMDLEALATGNAVTEAVPLAGIVLAELPIFLVFLVLQRYFMAGIERTGIVE